MTAGLLEPPARPKDAAAPLAARYAASGRMSAPAVREPLRMSAQAPRGEDRGGTPAPSAREARPDGGADAGTEADDDLVLACRRGEEEAFRALVERYQKRAYWAAYNMVGNSDDARDIIQEAFIRVFRSLERFEVGRKFYTWLYQIVSNLCIDHLRKVSTQKRVAVDDLGEIHDPGGGPHQKLEARELNERVETILRTLPPKYRLVISLRDIEGLSAKEIAGITGSTHATVRWRLHRARGLFRESWERTYAERPGGEAVP